MSGGPISGRVARRTSQELLPGSRVGHGGAARRVVRGGGWRNVLVRLLLQEFEKNDDGEMACGGCPKAARGPHGVAQERVSRKSPLNNLIVVSGL
jgi:hypothetical protein